MLGDLDYADDISQINESIVEAENPLYGLELSTQATGLFLNAKKANSNASIIQNKRVEQDNLIT